MSVTKRLLFMVYDFAYFPCDKPSVPDANDGLGLSEDEDEDETGKQPGVAELLAEIGLQDFITVFEAERINIETLVILSYYIMPLMKCKKRQITGMKMRLKILCNDTY